MLGGVWLDCSSGFVSQLIFFLLHSHWGKEDGGVRVRSLSTKIHRLQQTLPPIFSTTGLQTCSSPLFPVIPYNLKTIDLEIII